MINYFPNSKSEPVALNDKQFCLLMVINAFSFVNANQLNLIWSVINKKHLTFSYSVRSRWINDYKLLEMFSPTSYKARTSKPRRLLHPVYHLSSKAEALLRSYGISTPAMPYGGYNSHNEQAIEVVVQALVLATFKPSSFGSGLDFMRCLGGGGGDAPVLNIYPENSRNYYGNFEEFLRKLSENYPDFLRNFYEFSPEFLRNFSLFFTPNFRNFCGKKADKWRNFSAFYPLISSPLERSNKPISKLSNPYDFFRKSDNIFFRKSSQKVFRKNLISEDKTHEKVFRKNSKKFSGKFSGKNQILNHVFDNSKFDLSSIPKELLYSIPAFYPSSSDDDTLVDSLLSSTLLSSFTSAMTTRTEFPTKLTYWLNSFDFDPFLLSHLFQYEKYENNEQQVNSLPKFSEIENLDIRSFALQMGIDPTKVKTLPFVADQMLSFNFKGRRNEIFVELDNRTESNKVQIQKMINYIWYAIKHPDRDVLVEFAITDGSLPTGVVSRFTNSGRKLGSLLSTMLTSYVSENKTQFYSLYEYASNLTICISGVSQAAYDICSFMLKPNYIPDYLNSINRYTRAVSKVSDWNVTFTPSKALSSLLNQTVSNYSPNKLFSLSTTDFDCASLTGGESKMKNPKLKGIWRYVNYPMNKLPVFGTLTYKHKLKFETKTRPVIAGEEHDFTTFLLSYSKIWSNKSIPAMVVFPTRERRLTTLSLPQYKQRFKWNPYNSFKEPVYLQPQYNYEDDPDLVGELFDLKFQYYKRIFKYYKSGKRYNTGIAVRHPYLRPPKEWEDYSPRTFEELNVIANMDKMNAECFISQLSIYEMPLTLFNELIEVTANGSYTLPIITPLEYENDLAPTRRWYPPIKKDSILNYLYLPNSTSLTARDKLKIRKTE